MTPLPDSMLNAWLRYRLTNPDADFTFFVQNVWPQLQSAPSRGHLGPNLGPDPTPVPTDPDPGPTFPPPSPEVDANRQRLGVDGLFGQEQVPPPSPGGGFLERLRTSQAAGKPRRSKFPATTEPTGLPLFSEAEGQQFNIKRPRLQIGNPRFT